MLKLIVPPPMLLASRIAWRNEPTPLSLVLVTVKANGVPGLFLSDDWCSIVVADSLSFRASPLRESRVGMSEAIAHFMGKPGDCCPADQSGTDEQ